MPTRSRDVLVALVAFGLLGSGVAACAGHEPTGPRTLPRASEHREPSPAAAPASATTAGGAVTETGAATALVRRYYRAANRLATDMDPTALASLFTADCPCRAQVRAVRQAARRHEHYVDRARLLAVHASVEDRNHAYVLVDLDASAGGLARANGTRVTSARPQHHVQRVFRLVRLGRSWLIERIEAP